MSERREIVERIQRYYTSHPRMVSSPFGGVDQLQTALFLSTLRDLGISLENRAVLDIGCGRGFACELVQESRSRYVGIDLVASRVAFPFVLGSAENLPFSDGAFDLLFCIDAFEHFPYPEHAVSEFRRVLRRGGSVFLSVPNYTNVAGLLKWWCEKSGTYKPYTWAPFGRWQPQEYESPLTLWRVQKLFSSGGFSVGARKMYSKEIGVGLFPWVDHPNMPESVRYFLQKFFAAAEPLFSNLISWMSMHAFWRFDAV
ncbi:MAG TPA: class I SAM-dependent methyltransferase [Candidatus Hydrogenedentes bacterium]|nr:class I SAM-dependent methyltransferase [Candidatus Hydrogenedentota bacterium]HOL77004.1 class I SAM-dependent methyltransferase [Candidatus Hydrogenedentota bacterium]HPO85813.1 class I SAM-dependent methyltransferase [Candidatus Hydrogenedentota bacterium]